MQKQKLKQSQKFKLSKEQIQFLGLLQIPLIALEKRIEEELEKNPALEEEEEENNDIHFFILLHRDEPAFACSQSSNFV